MCSIKYHWQISFICRFNEQINWPPYFFSTRPSLRKISKHIQRWFCAQSAKTQCPNLAENILNLGPQQEFEVRALKGEEKALTLCICCFPHAVKLKDTSLWIRQHFFDKTHRKISLSNGFLYSQYLVSVQSFNFHFNWISALYMEFQIGLLPLPLGLLSCV